ncbi:MAG: serine O-acetyltransferase, partial [Janthinobacterium lividum]
MSQLQASPTLTLPTGRLWTMMRREAESAIRRDSSTSRIIERALLRHDSLADALGHRLAEKLGDDDFSRDEILGLAREAFAAEPDLMPAVTADLTAILDRDAACPDHITP